MYKSLSSCASHNCKDVEKAGNKRVTYHDDDDDDDELFLKIQPFIQR